MHRSLLGLILLVGSGLATQRRWISLPFACAMGLAWLAAMGWLPVTLEIGGAFPPLAECALWTELGWIVLARIGPAAGPVRERALSGFMGGAVGGAALCLLGQPSWVPLPVAFMGATASAIGAGVGVLEAAAAAVLLPVQSEGPAGLVPTVFLAAVALGAVPR